MLKWYAPNEPHADKALEIRDPFLAGLIELHAPALLQYEVGVALARWGNKIRRKSPGIPYLTVTEAQQVLSSLWRMDIHLDALTAEAAGDAVRMSVSYSKGFKDMIFLRLAKELDCRLITADEKMVEAVPKSFPRRRILLLKDW